MGIKISNNSNQTLLLTLQRNVFPSFYISLRAVQPIRDVLQ